MAVRKSKRSKKADAKNADLSIDTESGVNEFMTTNQGLKINDDQNSLKAGERGGK
jgi:catalase